MPNGRIGKLNNIVDISQLNLNSSCLVPFLLHLLPAVFAELSYLKTKKKCFISK